MTCDDVRAQLLELPVDAFDRLEPHLARCPRCAALAERIRQQESEMTRYVDDYSHAPTFDASVAALRPPLPRAGRVVATAALALAALAALWVAAGGPPPTDRPPREEASMAPAPPDDGVDVVRFGVGRGVMLEMRRAPASLSIVDPDVAAVQSLGRPKLLQVMGLRPGRTQIVSTPEDGPREVLWLEVHDDATADVESASDRVVSVPEERLTLRVGERRFAHLDRVPRSVAVTDPDLVHVLFDGDRRELGIDGIAVGTTDILVQADGEDRVFVVTVEP